MHDNLTLHMTLVAFFYFKYLMLKKLSQHSLGYQHPKYVSNKIDIRLIIKSMGIITIFKKVFGLAKEYKIKHNSVYRVSHE